MKVVYEWLGKLDGKDYQLQGIDAFVTYAYTRISPGAYETIVKMGGRMAAKSTVTVSSDGKTMTTTTKGVDSIGRAVRTVTVYEKQ